MRLVKFPDGNMALEFKPQEFPLLLKVLEGFRSTDKESVSHLEEARQLVLWEIAGGSKGNDTIN